MEQGGIWRVPSDPSLESHASWEEGPREGGIWRVPSNQRLDDIASTPASKDEGIIRRLVGFFFAFFTAFTSPALLEEGGIWPCADEPDASPSNDGDVGLLGKVREGGIWRVPSEAGLENIISCCQNGED